MKEVIIIAGATGGVGNSLVNKAVIRDYNVVLIAKDEIMLKNLVYEIYQEKKDIEIVSYIIDIRKTSELEIENIFFEIYSKFGRIDYLINSIGMGIWCPIEETTLKTWNNILNVNLTGMFLLCKNATIYMKKQNKGIIINISSIAGKKGAAYSTAYCASKFGVLGLSYSMAEELKIFGIKVIAVILGGTDTNFVKKAISNSSQNLMDYIIENYLDVDKMKPEKVAEEIIFLLDSPHNLYINEIIIKA